MWKLLAAVSAVLALTAVVLGTTGGGGTVATGEETPDMSSIPGAASGSAPDRRSAPDPSPSSADAGDGDDTPAPGETTTSVAERTLPTGIQPVGLRIPALDVDARAVELDLTGNVPEVPGDSDAVGWYTQTRHPGEIGPAVMAGHVDSTTGPAVFFRLDELVVGDRIFVDGFFGGERIFEVTGAGQYPKDALPDEVFGFGTAEPELRLITCGGTFDRSTGHYRDNHVVYAREITS